MAKRGYKKPIPYWEKMKELGKTCTVCGEPMPLYKKLYCCGDCGDKIYKLRKLNGKK